MDKIVRQEVALRDIASQKLTSEIERIDGELQGDFEFAYDTMIVIARDALAFTPDTSDSGATTEPKNCPASNRLTLNPLPRLIEKED